jgi:hypothetical protein
MFLLTFAIQSGKEFSPPMRKGIVGLHQQPDWADRKFRLESLKGGQDLVYSENLKSGHGTSEGAA